MNTYLIRLNGAAFLTVTCPRWMEPVAVARAYMRGEELPELVTVESAM